MNVKEKIVYYLSRRDHSEKELSQKLKLKKYSPQEISEGLQWAKDKGYLGSPEKTSETLARGLHRKKKGILYIQQYLKMKGLPPVEIDLDLELEKALFLAVKYFKNPPYTFEEKQDIYKSLIRRGFLDKTIQGLLSMKKNVNE